MNAPVRFRNIVFVLAFVMATWSVWAFFNQPNPEPPWPATIQGFAFSPFGPDDDPAEARFPDEARIDQDLALLAGRTHAIRTYSVEGTLAEIPALADRHGINVALGAWIDDRPDENQRQTERAIRLAWSNENVVRVVVGNEVLLRGDLPVEELIGHLERVRAAVHQPVSTAEPWDAWLKYPELAEHVDYLAVHVLPYWEGIGIEEAVGHVVSRIELLEARFPDKPIVIAEVGWPSNGRTRRGAVASPGNEAVFLRRFLDEAERRDYVYYLMEAFDQPWKARDEGAVGAYWGVWSAEREPKFEWSRPLVDIPHWPVLAGISALIASIVLAVLLLDSRTLGVRGRSFLALVAFTAASLSVWVVNDYAQQYLDFESVAVGIALVVGMIGVIVVLFTEAHEWVEARWTRRWRRQFVEAIGSADDAELPMVSVHVPAYNEPPAMLIETLDALAKLDYPRFEVVVIDNNTPDEATWRPVEDHCEKLGERFRFFHQRPLAGFKGGALNYALARTAQDAEIIAAIDSDYVVDLAWLRDLVPLFANPEMAIVQAPQDYRDADESLFKALCHAEYRGFFHIGMVTRNERNAIIQHGTMTLVRKRALLEAGGWSEACITEDAELGLRLFERGGQAAYLPTSYGRGLMPDTFIDYKKQRFRWAFGAIQILRMHVRTLLGLDASRLSAGQRYHFLAGWLPWLADGFNLVFNFAALAWSAAMIWAPERFDSPLLAFAVLPLFLFGFKLAKLLHLYLTRVGAGVRQAVGAVFAGLALTHTIGVAVLAGLLQRERGFFRTPKRARRAGPVRAFIEAREETLMVVALWAAAWAVSRAHDLETPDTLVWVAVLLLQSLPYLIALLVALISSLSVSGRWLGDVEEMERGTSDLRLDREGEGAGRRD